MRTDVRPARGFVGSYHTKRNKKKMYYYRLSLGVDKNGKRIQPMKKGFHTEREAIKALREALRRADKGIRPMKVTYGEYLQDWVEIRKRQWGYQTEKNNRSILEHHIIPMLGHHKLTELSIFHIERFLEELRSKGLAESTIKKVYNLVNTSLHSAVAKDLIQKNVASFVENKPKPARKEVNVWTREEAMKFLNHVESTGSRYYAIFYLAIMTGMRQGEILGLRWQDVDLENRFISVNQTLSHDGKRFGKPKTKSSIRTLKICDMITGVLKKQKERILEEKERNKDFYMDYDLVNCTELGKPINPSDLNKAWNRLRDQAKLRKITFHDLRHTYASIMMNTNTHPKLVSKRLGHANIEITLDIYSHVYDELDEIAAMNMKEYMYGKTTAH